jgi:uncharacterized membrane protein YukC
MSNYSLGVGNNFPRKKLLYYIIYKYINISFILMVLKEGRNHIPLIYVWFVMYQQHIGIQESHPFMLDHDYIQSIN